MRAGLGMRIISAWDNFRGGRLPGWSQWPALRGNCTVTHPFQSLNYWVSLLYCMDRTNNSSAVAEIGDHLATMDMGKKVGGCCAHFRGGVTGSPSNTMLPGLRPTSVPNGILIHPSVCPQQTWAEKWGGCCAGLLGPHLTQSGLGRGLPAYQVASWSINHLATIHHYRQTDGTDNGSIS